MKATFVITMLILTTFIQTEPWTPAQLVDPSDLAARLKSPSGVQPLVISVGPSAVIKGSTDIGPGKDPQNIEKLKLLLEKQDRKREIIIYCGCCPFAHCPNVRPAFTLLKTMHFTNAHLLNLSHNIKTDWIDHGYPVNGK